METFTAAIGTQLRKLRSEMGLRQDDVASMARALGLRWSRVAVTRLEAGVGELDAAEFLMLPQVLMMASLRARGQSGLQGPERGVELTDLLPVSGMVALKPNCQVAAKALRAIVEGRSTSVSTTDLDVPLLHKLRKTQAAAVLAMGSLLAKQSAREDALNSVWPAATKEVRAQAILDAAGEAEQKAARKLDMDPAAVALAAQRLWHRSLTAERDRRVVERSSGESLRRVQAMRGHITRRLIADLRKSIENRE